jgi:hypothetical protein
MEGQMDNNKSGLTSKFVSQTRLDPKLENTADAAGLWFAAAVIFAAIVAGIILYYRADGSDIRTASNDVAVPAAARSSPVEIPPAYSHIEGIDP